MWRRHSNKRSDSGILSLASVRLNFWLAKEMNQARFTQLMLQWLLSVPVACVLCPLLLDGHAPRPCSSDRLHRSWDTLASQGVDRQPHGTLFQARPGVLPGASDRTACGGSCHASP